MQNRSATLSFTRTSQASKLTQPESKEAATKSGPTGNMRQKLLARLNARFAASTSGSILPLFALIALPMTIAVGATIDYTLFAHNRSKIINAADSAVLAAAVQAKTLPDLDNIAAVESALETEMENFLSANLNEPMLATYEIDEVRYDPETQAVGLTVGFTYNTSFMELAGIGTLEAQVQSGVLLQQDELNSISMFFVLDSSGSMIWGKDPTWGYDNRGSLIPVAGPDTSRLDSVKSAVTALHQQFEELDPDKNYIRTGVAAYSSALVGQRNMRWGSGHVNTFTKSLTANGSTNSSVGMSRAVQRLQGDLEKEKHAERNNAVPTRYIVFMTDGENNYDRQDRATRQHCRNAKNDGIIIYSIAFHAPERGRLLLNRCASSPNHYFTAENTEELVAIFRLIGEQASRDLHLTQ